MLRFLLCALLIAVPAAASPAEIPRPFAGLPSPLDRGLVQRLLQAVVDKLYMKAFRHIGDERDFDHGHILLDSAGRPVAILYHTQELAYYEPSGGPFAYVDPEARNWIQWIADGRIENASRYERKTYPSTAAWDWFTFKELPALRAHHTILTKMLDAEALGTRTESSLQWVFTRVGCSAEQSDRVEVTLPGGEKVCLALNHT